MVFSSDKQRKAVMAKLKGRTRSNTNPNIIKGNFKAIRERLRKRFKPTAEELAEERGARIKREAEALKLEKRRAEQLELEAKVESEREDIRKKETEARKRLAEIDRARRERTLTGRAVVRGRELARIGLKKLAEPVPAPRRRKRKITSKVSSKNDGGTAFFGIGDTDAPISRKKKSKDVDFFQI